MNTGKVEWERRRRQPLPSSPPLEPAQALRLLQHGKLESLGLLPWGSNYTFLSRVSDGKLMTLAVYKPRKGERPLWDFPTGTLCQREVAAYVVAEGLGWPIVPPTVLRDGPYGMGAVQLHIDADPEAHYFTFRERYPDQLQRIAVYDIVVNNADRKGGHCLLDANEHIWAIDHGITFHEEPKLRTVIWDYAGQPIPEHLLDDVAAFQQRFNAPTPLREALCKLLAEAELQAMNQRIRFLLRTRVFPRPYSDWSVPWPPV